MGTRLPKELELLASGEPLLDIWANPAGPWRVPGDLYAEISGRLVALVDDPRAAPYELPVVDMDSRFNRRNPILTQVDRLVRFLPGAGAVVGGSRGDLVHELLFPFLGGTPERRPTAWHAWAESWNPLVRMGRFKRPEEGLVLLALAREALQAFAGIEPLEARRQGLLRLFDLLSDRPTEPFDPWGKVTDEAVLAAVPELGGPTAYARWAWTGFRAAHLELGSDDSPAQALAELLHHHQGRLRGWAGTEKVLDEADHAGFLDHRTRLREGVGPWAERCVNALVHAVENGAADSARTWLDGASRLIDAPSVPQLPVERFLGELLRMAELPPARPGRDARLRATSLATVGDRIVGQPQLVSALVDLPGGSPVRLLVTGPAGTFKTAAVDLVHERLAAAGDVDDEPLWLDVRHMERPQLDDAMAACRGRRVLVLSHLRAPPDGDLLDHDDLHVVGLATVDLVDARFHLVRTYDLRPDDREEVFRRAVVAEEVGVDPAALWAAGKVVQDAPDNRVASEWLARVAVVRARSRVAGTGPVVVTEADVPEALHGGGDPLAALDGLVGCEGVKQQVRQLVVAIQAEGKRRQLGMQVQPPRRNLVFAAGPGTGTSTVARMLSRIYHHLGVLSKGHVVEATRTDLRAEAAKVIDRAVGGVLLIDDAHWLDVLGPGDREILQILEARLDDHRRGDLVVILRGPAEKVAELLDGRPSLAVHFPRVVHFADYSIDELVALFEARAERAGLQLRVGVTDTLRRILTARDAGIPNARLLVNLFDRALAAQASRVLAEPEGSHHHTVALLDLQSNFST